MSGTTASDAAFFWQRWILFGLVSLIFFLITAATFTSLGVVLPYMIGSLGWTRLEAGTGFSLLALMVGLGAPVPAYLLRVIGLKATYVVGGLVVMAGVAALATTTSLVQFYVGASVLGFGYSLCASVPAIHMINNWIPDRQSFAIGTYMMIGGLGGVAAPFLVTLTVDMTGSWHAHWWTLAGAMAVLTVFSMLLLKEKPDVLPEALTKAPEAGEDKPQRVHKSEHEWTVAEAIRTPQYYVVVGALTLMLLCSVTMNTWAFAHMTSLGVATSTAAAVLSMQAVVNALSRALGGTLATFIDPKWLLVSALVADVIGMVALSFADSPVARILFVLFDGYGYGMCFFATTMLLVNYYGAKASPGVIGVMNFITTLAMIGPALGGIVGDSMGSFVWLFRGYAALLMAFSLVVIMTRPPRSAARKAELAGAAAVG